MHEDNDFLKDFNFKFYLCPVCLNIIVALIHEELDLLNDLPSSKLERYIINTVANAIKN